MEIDQVFLEKLKLLPFEQKKEALDFIEFLEYKTRPKQPRKSLDGLWQDLNIEIASEDLDKVRQEMWENFPREDI